MEIISMPMRGGKTTRLCQMALADKNKVILTFSIKEQQRILKLYPDLRGRVLVARLVISDASPVPPPGRRKYYIDNADVLLENVVSRWGSLEGITISQELREEPKRTVVRRKVKRSCEKYTTKYKPWK